MKFSSRNTSKCWCSNISSNSLIILCFKDSMSKIKWIIKFSNLIIYKMEKSICNSLLWSKNLTLMYRQQHIFQIQILCSKIKYTNKKCITINNRIQLTARVIKFYKISFSKWINSDVIYAILYFHSNSLFSICVDLRFIIFFI